MTRATKTYEERILKMDQKELELSEKLRQYQAKKKQLESAKRKDDERKRVHRLIPIGAVVEKVLGRPIENEDLPKLERFLRQQERSGSYFSRAMNQET